MSSTQTTSAALAPELLLSVDSSSPRTLREQVERELRRAIGEGRLTVGDRLPSSRGLAAELGISRSVVVEAYSTLVTAGYLEGRQGSRTRVRSDGSSAPEAGGGAPTATPARYQADFVSGLPDAATFPRTAWHRHYRAALTSLPDAALAYPEFPGVGELRRALARYLGRVRSVSTTPDRLVVCNGFTQGLALLARMLVRRGVTAIAVEDPCFAHHREVLAHAGLSVLPVTADEHGLVPGALAGTDVGAVLVAPAHCYPLGATLSAARRVELLHWAGEANALIIEDDYDAEYRYDRRPIGALQGLAPERVVYAGSVSKTLSPALRIGWLALPERFVEPVLREKLHDDIATGALEQATLARFLESGDLTRHLRRVAPMYRRRRRAALAAVERHLPSAQVRGTAAGLHLFVELPSGVDEQELIDAAAVLGVRLEGAAPHYADREGAQGALVLGYGATSEQAVERGLAAVSPLYRSMSHG